MIAPNEPIGGKPNPAPRDKTFSALDTSNQFQVVPFQGQITILGLPTAPDVKVGYTMTKAQAVNLAAWLVAIADPDGKEFDQVVKEITKGEK